MALPTKGRVIIDTTVGEIDIELWSKVCQLNLLRAEEFQLTSQRVLGNTQNMSEFHCVGHGRCVNHRGLNEKQYEHPPLGYYDGVIFHR